MKIRHSSTTGGREQSERLDQLGDALIRASALADEDVEAAASPRLARLTWARIAAACESQRVSGTWFDLLFVGRRAVPAMLVLAVSLAGWCWIGGSRSTGSRIVTGDASV